MELSVSLMFIPSGEQMRDIMCPIGAIRKYYESGTPGPHADWITSEEVSNHKRIFSAENGGYGPPLNWYKCQLAGLNNADEATVAEENSYLNVPTLLVTAKQDPVGKDVMQVEMTKPWVKEELLTIKEVDSGHWIQLEKPEETNTIIEQFL